MAASPVLDAETLLPEVQPLYSDSDDFERYGSEQPRSFNIKRVVAGVIGLGLVAAGAVAWAAGGSTRVLGAKANLEHAQELNYVPEYLPEGWLHLGTGECRWNTCDCQPYMQSVAAAQLEALLDRCAWNPDCLGADFDGVTGQLYFGAPGLGREVNSCNATEITFACDSDSSFECYTKDPYYAFPTSTSTTTSTTRTVTTTTRTTTTTTTATRTTTTTTTRTLISTTVTTTRTATSTATITSTRTATSTTATTTTVTRTTTTVTATPTSTRTTTTGTTTTLTGTTTTVTATSTRTSTSTRTTTATTVTTTSTTRTTTSTAAPSTPAPSTPAPTTRATTPYPVEETTAAEEYPAGTTTEESYE